ncbi:MAG: CvpA family protein [Thermodesulfobacteriota bacterium]
MNLLDLGILVLLALITVRGYYRGLFQELSVLAGVVGGLLAAAHTYLLVAARLQPWIKNPTYARILAFILVLVGVYWFARILGYLLQRILYHLYLDLFDRLLGAFFALVKGALLLGFALMLLGVVLPRSSQLIKESRTCPILMDIARQALGMLPPEFRQRLEEILRKIPKSKQNQQAGLPGIPLPQGPC